MALDDAARRRIAKALAALSPLKQPETSLKLGWSKDRLRTALDAKKKSPPTTDELLQLARLVEVPEHFVFEGFGEPLHQRVADLERAMAKLEERADQSDLEVLRLDAEIRAIRDADRRGRRKEDTDR
jgi:hypothetical protein